MISGLAINSKNLRPIYIRVQALSSTRFHCPAQVKSESDSKIYTKIEFGERENHKLLKKHIDLQSQAIYVDNLFSRKVYIF